MDNISHLGQEESDWLCKVVTGGGYAKRLLYTNSDLVIRRLRRLVILNGIDLVAKRPDLLDRCIIIELNRIAPEKRLPENVLNAKFDEKLPKLLGACFDLLAKAYSIKPSIKLSSYPRMADFAHWGAAILKAYRPELSEDDFCELYNRNIEVQESESINSSQIAQCLIRYLDEKGTSITGTPTEVLKILKDAYPYTYKLPESVNSFGKKIKELVPSLEKIGIKVEHEKGVTRRYVISSSNSVVKNLSSQPSSCLDEPLDCSSVEVPF